MSMQKRSAVQSQLDEIEGSDWSDPLPPEEAAFACGMAYALAWVLGVKIGGFGRRPGSPGAVLYAFELGATWSQVYAGDVSIREDAGTVTVTAGGRSEKLERHKPEDVPEEGGGHEQA
jgi:hypothetical protein